MSTPRPSRLRYTVGSLYAVQIAGYVLPLVTFPYLLRVLGPESFGVYAFAVLVARFGIMLTDYGFAYSATRTIARLRGAGTRADDEFTAVMVARLALVAVVAAALVVLPLVHERFAERTPVFWVIFAGVAGSALVPTWLFQAYERLPVVAGVNLAARTVATVLTFVLVRDTGDVMAAAWLWSAPWIVSGVATLVLARRLLGTRFVRVGARRVGVALGDGLHVFVSLLAASLYTTANGIILGLVGTDVDVGHYAAAEGVVIAAAGLVTPLSQAMYPRSVLAAERGPAALRANTRRLLRLFGVVGGVTSAVLVLGAPLIAGLVFGDGYGPSVDVLRIMGVIPLAIAVATVLSVHTLMPLGRDRDFSRIVVAVGIANLGLTTALAVAFRGAGSGAAACISEIAVVVCLAVLLGRPGTWTRTRPPSRPAPAAG